MFGGCVWCSASVQIRGHRMMSVLLSLLTGVLETELGPQHAPLPAERSRGHFRLTFWFSLGFKQNLETVFSLEHILKNLTIGL